MRTETMIAGAVALVSGYNAGATAADMFSYFTGPTNAPHLPYEFFGPSAALFVVSGIATVWLGAEDLTNYAVRGNPRPFESLTLPCKRR